MPDFNADKVEFAVFCIENVAIKLFCDSSELYKKLKDSGILYYIVSSYDVLHTQSKEYIVDDIIKTMKLKGVA